MTVTVREDRSVGGGGYAVVHVPGALLPGGDVEMHIRRIGFDRSNLGPDGWQGPEAPLRPRFVTPTADGLEIGIGPEIVDRISFGTPVEIEVPALGLRSVLHWPDIAPSVGDTGSARTRVLAVEPTAASPAGQPGDTAEPAGDALADEPLRAMMPDSHEFADPTRVYGWELDADRRRSRIRTWAAVAVAVVVVGTGAAWFLTGEEDPFAETPTASLPAAEEAVPPSDAPEDRSLAEPSSDQPAVEVPTELATPLDAPPASAAPDVDVSAVITGAGSPFEAARRLRDLGLAPEALFDHGRQLLGEGQADTALLLFQLAEQSNHAPSIREIGRMYDPVQFDNGRTAFAQPNPAEAARLYGLAAAQGDAVAVAARAALYNWVAERAEEGDPEMQTLLQEQFDEGEG